MSARERAHIDQDSQLAVRLLIILLLLILAIYDIKVMIAECCFPCTRRMLPRRFYSPSCRQGEDSETPIHPLGCLCVRTGAKRSFGSVPPLMSRQLATRLDGYSGPRAVPRQFASFSVLLKVDSVNTPATSRS